jgi:hypothetical protein
MNIRQILINVIAFSVTLTLFNVHGITLSNWEFWAVLICMMTIQINSAMD